MELIAVDAAGVAHFTCAGHRFRAALADVARVRKPGGTPDEEFVATPPMACLDPGCAVVAQTTFPLVGDDNAQRVHAYRRAQRAKAPLPPDGAAVASAVAAVNADVRARGGVDRASALPA